MVVDMDDATEERRDYIKDAWADVAVTLAFVAASLFVAYLDSRIHHQSTLTRITVTSFEFGFAVAVINHVVLILWNRTVLGKLGRHLLARRRAKRNKPDGGVPSTGKQISDSLPNSRSAQEGAVDMTSSRSLLAPRPGGAGKRAVISLTLAVLATLACSVFVWLKQESTLRAWSYVGTIVFFSVFSRKSIGYFLLTSAVAGSLWGAERRRGNHET